MPHGRVSAAGTFNSKFGLPKVFFGTKKNPADAEGSSHPSTAVQPLHGALIPTHLYATCLDTETDIRRPRLRHCARYAH